MISLYCFFFFNIVTSLWFPFIVFKHPLTRTCLVATPVDFFLFSVQHTYILANICNEAAGGAVSVDRRLLVVGGAGAVWWVDQRLFGDGAGAVGIIVQKVTNSEQVKERLREKLLID